MAGTVVGVATDPGGLDETRPGTNGSIGPTGPEDGRGRGICEREMSALSAQLLKLTDYLLLQRTTFADFLP